MASKAGVRGVPAMQANFRAYDAAVQKNVRAAQQQNGLEHQQAVKDEAPKLTGFLASKVQLSFSEGGLAYEVFHQDSDFLNAGFAAYYWFVIFGTSRMAGNDYMFRATERFKPIGVQRIREAMKSAEQEVAK
jgi:hypothetical protein